MKKITSRVLVFVPLIVWSVIVLFPVYWMIITSFKIPVDIIRGPVYIPWGDFQPDPFAWQGIFNGTGDIDIMGPLKNSIFAATVSALVATALGSMAAYGLARFNYRWGPWRNRDIAFWFISQRMLPPAAAILAFMLMYKYLHLLDSVIGLTIAYIGFNLPFAVWIMRDFFAALPRELEESALVEGATWFIAFVRVALPLAVPGLAATAILLFIFSWNEYLFASLLAFQNARTIPVTIAGAATSIGIRWWTMSALALISMIPTVVLGLILERHIVRGLTIGALK